MYHLAKECSSIGPLLEIGSYCGKSALYIGQAAKECRQILYSVDHHQGSEEQQPGEAYHDPDLLNEEGNGINTLPFFLETIRLAGLQNHVIPIVSSSEKAAKNLQKELSFEIINLTINKNQKVEKRIAITPEIAKKYISLGIEVSLPENYASHLGFRDEEYKELGVSILKDDIFIMINETILLIIGFCGQGLFASRFLVQWIYSEKKGESSIPVIFWYLSIFGGLGLLTYAIFRKDPVIITVSN